MDRKVTVKFWQLHPSPDGGATFHDAIALAFEQPEATRFRDLEGVVYQLFGEVVPGGETIVGDVVRLQSEALPTKIKAGEKPSALDLAGHSLGHHTGFIYDKATRILGFEIKLTAAGLTKVLALVAELSGQKPCIATPVLNKSTLEQLAGKKNGTFQFKVADPASLETVDPQMAEMRDSLRELKGMVDGVYVNVSIGVGPRKKGLEQQKLLGIVGWLLGERAAGRGKVRAVKVVQPTSEEPILDFIQGQAKASEALNLIGNPEQDWIERRKFLVKALAGAKANVPIEN